MQLYIQSVKNWNEQGGSAAPSHLNVGAAGLIGHLKALWPLQQARSLLYCSHHLLTPVAGKLCPTSLRSAPTYCLLLPHPLQGTLHVWSLRRHRAPYQTQVMKRRLYSPGRGDTFPFPTTQNQKLREPVNLQTGEGHAPRDDLPAAPELPKTQRDPLPLHPAPLPPDRGLSTDKEQWQMKNLTKKKSI